MPFVHEGLGNSSYLVGIGEGRAMLVDPDRSVERYLQATEGRGWEISHVFETHLHADFVSGALEVRAATGAEIFVPLEADVRFDARPLAGGTEVTAGGGRVTAISSPGHTPEHLGYVLQCDASPPALFSGGSMLVGGAARTDLIAPELTDGLTRAQFRTLRRAFSHLPDETLLLPTHGRGSFCSSGGGKQRTSTLGEERRTNPLLAFDDEDEFASWFPSTFPAAPTYFSRMRPVNQAGPRLRSQIPQPRMLEPAEARARSNHAVVLDVRPQRDFMAAHVPGSISNTFREGFATWLGWLIPSDVRLLLVLGNEPLSDVVEECLLVGYEKFAGVLGDGMAGWIEAGFETARATARGAAAVKNLLLDGAVALDVREPNEFAAGHIPGAVQIPLGDLQRRTRELPRDRPIVTYCGHGERSATGLSLLERLEFGPLVNLDGGFCAWEDAGLEVER